MIDTIEQLVAQHLPDLRAAARHYLDPQDVDDCVQGALVNIWKHWDEHQPETCLAWARQVVRHEALDTLRRRVARQRSSHFSIEAGFSEVNTPSCEAEVVARLTLACCLKRLPPILRSAVRLWSQGLYIIPGKTLSASKALQHRGRRMVKAMAA